MGRVFHDLQKTKWNNYISTRIYHLYHMLCVCVCISSLSWLFKRSDWLVYTVFILTARSEEMALHSMLPITATFINSAFHPSGVGKSSNSLHWLGLRRGVFACVGWQGILCDCDPIWQATPVVLRWISIKNLSLL